MLEQEDSKSHISEQAIEDAKELEWIDSGEAVNRWKDEEEIMEAECKVKFLIRNIFFRFSLYLRLFEEMIFDVMLETRVKG